MISHSTIKAILATCLLYVIVTCIVLIVAVPANAADYVVSPAGDDANAGTAEAPWKTIGKANTALQSGDSVTLRSGSYTEIISPVAQNTTFRAEKGDVVVITGESGSEPLADLRQAYVTVDNIIFERVKRATGRYADVIIGGHHGTIRNITIRNMIDSMAELQAKRIYTGIEVGGADALIEGSRIDRASGAAIKVLAGALRATIRNNALLDSGGDSIRIDSSRGILQGHLIEGNILLGSKASDGIQTNAAWGQTPEEWSKATDNRGIVIRNNTIGGHAENGIDLKGTSDIVVDGNVIYGTIGNNDGMSDGVADTNASGGAITRGSNATSKNVIIRRNILMDSHGGTALHQNWMVYHNTLAGNNRDVSGTNSGRTSTKKPPFFGVNGSPAGAAIKNNIIVDHNSAQVATKLTGTIDIDGNLYWDHERPNAAPFAAGEAPYTEMIFPVWKKALEGSASLVGDEAHSAEAAPLFLNVPPRPTGDPSHLDFRLAKGSPAIDSGIPLTTAVGSGTDSARIVVKQARYFYDGYGVTKGDTIRVGDSDVTIEKVDYNTNTLTLAKAIVWADNAPITLPYHGKAPDKGAFESEPPKMCLCPCLEDATKVK